MKTKRRKEATPEQRAAAAEKRAELIAISKTVKAAMESGQMPDAERVNDGIISIYQDRTGESDFRSFHGWQDEGFQVRKGEKAFLIWGKPRAARSTGEPEPCADPTDPEKKYKLYPLAYIFHAGQVEPLDPTKPRRERKPRTEPTDPDPDPLPSRKAHLAAKLRTLADGMESEIENKMNPSIANQNPTRRRHAIAQGMREDGKALQLAQTVLRTAADCHEGNGVERNPWLSELDAPSILSVTTKAAAIEYARKNRALIMAAMERGGAAPKPGADWKAQYRAALGDLIGAKYDGFFPTGDNLAKIVMEKAHLGTGNALQILEPSAGVGNLALAAIEEIGATQSKIWTLETVPRLSAVLDIIAAGNPETVQNIGPMDFFDYEDSFSELGFPAEFDRIVMNPPFEKGQDMAHVQAAHSLLKAGGILVAIMCANVQYRTDGEYPAFRDWLDSIGAEIEKAPDDSFSGTIRTTKTAAVIVTIQKD